MGIRHVTLAPEVRSGILAMNTATIDRSLRTVRVAGIVLRAVKTLWGTAAERGNNRCQPTVLTT